MPFPAIIAGFAVGGVLVSSGSAYGTYRIWKRYKVEKVKVGGSGPLVAIEAPIFLGDRAVTIGLGALYDMSIQKAEEIVRPLMMATRMEYKDQEISTPNNRHDLDTGCCELCDLDGTDGTRPSIAFRHAENGFYHFVACNDCDIQWVTMQLHAWAGKEIRKHGQDVRARIINKELVTELIATRKWLRCPKCSVPCDGRFCEDKSLILEEGDGVMLDIPLDDPEAAQTHTHSD